MATEIQAGDGSGNVKSRKSKRSCPVTVKFIKREGKSALVEWTTGKMLRRVTIPANELRGNDVDKDVLAQGIPYGEDWGECFAKFPNSDAIANELRRRDIWTRQDFKRLSMQARAAILKIAVNPAIAELLRTLEV